MRLAHGDVISGNRIVGRTKPSPKLAPLALEAAGPGPGSVPLSEGATHNFGYMFPDLQASADNLDGPWENVAQSPITPRPGKWDGWHLSAGPIIGEGTKQPTMFYNGAMQDASWRIGWVTFDERLTKLVDRCEEPLICPEDALSEGSTDIAFAASAVERDGKILLYYSQSDQDLRCATIRRG